MCLGVPGLIVEREPAQLAMPSAVVEFAGVRRPVCVACVPEAEVGDYVIVHAGLAISRLDAEEAERLLECLRQIGEDEGWEGAPAPPAEGAGSP
jgi:hydrogenase expression/formation protein HypC